MRLELTILSSMDSKSGLRSGFVRYSSIPMDMLQTMAARNVSAGRARGLSVGATHHFSRSPVIAWAVRAMMGTRSKLLESSYFRMMLVASIPPMKGIETSMRTTS